MSNKEEKIYIELAALQMRAQKTVQDFNECIEDENFKKARKVADKISPIYQNIIDVLEKAKKLDI